MRVARKGLQQGSGSWDQVPVLGNDELTFEGSGRGMGMEDVDLEMRSDLKLMAGTLDMS